MNQFENKRYLPKPRTLLFKPKSLVELLKQEFSFGNWFSRKTVRTFYIFKIYLYEIQFINYITLS